MNVAKKQRSPAEVIAARRQRLSMQADIRALILRIIVIGLAAYLFFTQLFFVGQVHGMNMFPAVKDGDLAIVFRLQGEYAKGDVVAYQTADGVSFGRIAACAGDVISMDDTGDWLVNGTLQTGEILYPTYALEGMEYPYLVPEGSLFILGDYRTKATDSRIYGAIPMEQLVGKTITILRRRSL